MIKTLDLRTLGLSEGNHTIKAIGKRAYYVQSVVSSEKTWAPDWLNIICTVPELFDPVNIPELILEGHGATLQLKSLLSTVTPTAVVSGASYTEAFDRDALTYNINLSNPISDVSVGVELSGEINTTYDLSAINNKEGQTYGFTYSSSSGLTPQNKSQHNSFAWTKLNFHMPVDGTVTLTLYQSSESSYDFGLVSYMDKELVKDSADTTTNVYVNNKGGSGTKTVTFTNVSAGDHFITFKYRKDGSQSSGSDECRITGLSSKGALDISSMHRIDYIIDEALTLVDDATRVISAGQDVTLIYQIPDAAYFPNIVVSNAEYESSIDTDALELTLVIRNATGPVSVSISAGDVSPAVPITFWIDLDGEPDSLPKSEMFSADQGMTWAEWLDTDYNKNGYWQNLLNGVITVQISGSTSGYGVAYNGEFVSINDVIVADRIYDKKSGNHSGGATN